MPTINSSGTPIYYESKGTGSALVFAHEVMQDDVSRARCFGSSERAD